MQVLGCLLSLLFIGFFVVLGIGMTILARIRQFFTGGSRPASASPKPEASDAGDRRVLFDDDEGEYVDFEEVDEESTHQQL